MNKNNRNRQSRQKEYYLKVTLSFILFCLIAVPFQFHIKWYESLYSKHRFSSILISAPLYFYSITLCLEAHLRLIHYHKLLNDIRIYILRYFLYVPILIFVFQYFVSPFYDTTNDSLPLIEVVIQLLAGISGVLLSIAVHHQITKYQMRRIK